MNRFFKWSIPAAALLGLGLLAPAGAFAQDVEAAESMDAFDDELDAILEDDSEPESKAFSVTAGVRTSIGQGTFASVSNDTEYAGEVHDGSGAFNRVSLIYSLGPSYKLGDFSFSLNMGITQWLSAGTGGYYGANEAGGWRFQDMSLGIGWKGHEFESTKIKITPSLTFGIPTSTISRASTLYFDSTLGVGVSRTFFEKLTLSYSLSGMKYFHEFKTPVFSIERIGQDNALYRAGGAEEVKPGHISPGGYNSEYLLSNSVSARVSVWSTLSASVSYGFHNYWSYHFENDDEYTSEFSDTTGRSISQVTATSIGLGYGINDWLSASASLGTVQTPKTADNKSYRFPFWNFTGAAANSSAISLGLSGSY